MSEPSTDSDSGSAARQIAVVGGGISGLAAAHHVVELDPAAQVTLFEASTRLGGVLQTVHRDGFLLEKSADNFLTNVPWAVDLCRRIGFEEELLQTNSENRRALVVHRGKLLPVPEGFLLLAPQRVGPVLRSPLLSWRGKLRLACERFVPARREGSEESLSEFARRRLGRETFDRIVQPLVGGIYTADPDRLSVAATMPRFTEMESQHGSLTRGMKQSQAARRQAESNTGARYSMFVAPRRGMSSLVEAIADRLPVDSIQYESPVEHIAQTENGRWRVRHARGEYRQSQVHDYDGVVLATPVQHTARMLESVAPQAASELACIESASSAVVTFALRRSQIDHPLDGFGFVVPAAENRQILAGSFTSNKFPGRAPEGCVCIRVFLGGALQSELLQRDDDELTAIAGGELAELIGLSGEPLFATVTRWNEAMPQYHVGHTALIERVEASIAEQPGLEIAGNVFTGVGVPNCIHSGEQAAERVLGQ